VPSKDSGDDVGFKLLKENEMLQQKWVLAGKLKKKMKVEKKFARKLAKWIESNALHVFL